MRKSSVVLVLEDRSFLAQPECVLHKVLDKTCEGSGLNGREA